MVKLKDVSRKGDTQSPTTTVIGKSLGGRHEDALVRAVEKYVPDEIARHLSSLTVYAQLRAGLCPGECNGGHNNNANVGAISCSGNCKNGNAAVSCDMRRRNCGIMSGCKRDVHLESCVSRVLSCRVCHVLRGYCAFWVESMLTIRTVTSASTNFSRHKRLRRSDDVAVVADCVVSSGLDGAGGNRRYNVKLLTLHIVDNEAYKNPGNYVFVLQSVCQPGRVLQLECYPNHMIRFGLLMHFLWQCPCEAFAASQAKGGTGKEKDLRRLQVNSAFSSTDVDILPVTDFNECNSCGMSLHLSTSPAAKEVVVETQSGAVGPSVLVLGLGANVIGNWLDEALPPNVRIDVVEVEPTVLQICRDHKQVPPCDELVNEANEGTGVWCVTRGHKRYPNYRFIVGDAREVLKESNDDGRSEGRNKKCISLSYDVVFLDCYDPAKECMMHDANLVDLCRVRLRPGGALIVNAHIIPEKEMLQEQFLDRGFSSVQVLRVSSCNQSIVVCLASHSGSAGKTTEEVDGERLSGRFTVLSAGRATRYIHNIIEAGNRVYLHKPNTCYFGAGWLKSSKVLENDTCFVKLWTHVD
ncbi:methyltransferase domain containing protein, putative [Trypanosoma equiperdum]|uniref:Methyltransferase domain containing protein, putative n=1 Tax=Trypanosoma equiperdum TaxID=5694 RepID=A0A1G4I1V2_TRYEQ|nr:methyltransferase domain containing protein, putative [Trypanosoma equiperdum]